MLEQLTNWVLGSKKAIAAFVITTLVGVLKAQGIEVVPADFLWLQTVLEGVVVAVVVWFTRNQVGAVSRKK